MKILPAVTGLTNPPFTSADKGIPVGFPQRLGSTQPNILDEDLHFPLLVIKETALANNIEAMASWCAANGFLLAPHGKTTMCPQIFDRQQRAGAWGITVATASQAAVCVQAGLKRILIANQVLGKANIHSLAAMARMDGELEIVCLVDSLATIEILSREWQAANVGRPLSVLIEVGRTQWRTGVRSVEEVLRLHAGIEAHPACLRFRGIEGFEGLAHAETGNAERDQVNEFLDLVSLSAWALLERSPVTGSRLICSVGGSSFLDCVLTFGQRMKSHFDVIVRSGCYVTHDHGYYAAKSNAAATRVSSAGAIPRFQPALELWSHVQSTPEHGLAVLSFGKRDCAYDIDLPVPLFARSALAPGTQWNLQGHSITHCNDQHAYLSGPDCSQLRPGDQVCCGISHPCTAFDKWRVLLVVDDDYNLIDMYRTYF